MIVPPVDTDTPSRRPARPILCCSIFVLVGSYPIFWDLARTRCAEGESLMIVTRSWTSFPWGHSYDAEGQFVVGSNTSRVHLDRSSHWKLETSGGTTAPVASRLQRTNLLDPLHATWAIDFAASPLEGEITRDLIGFWTPYDTVVGGRRFYSTRGWLWGRSFKDEASGSAVASAESFMWKFPLKRYRICINDALVPATTDRLALTATVAIADMQNDHDDDNR